MDEDWGQSEEEEEEESDAGAPTGGAAGAEGKGAGREEDGEDDDSSDESESEGAGRAFALHEAVEKGDLEAAGQLIEQHMKSPVYLERRERIMAMPEEDKERREVLLAAWERDHLQRLLGRLDEEGCSPLHLAVLARKVDVFAMLLKKGAIVSSRCNNAPLTHLIMGVGSLRAHQAFAVEALRVLLQHKPAAGDEAPSMAARDDLHRSCLHLAAEFDFADAIPVLGGDGRSLEEVWPLTDMEGRTAMHVACRTQSKGVLSSALTQSGGAQLAAKPDPTGMTALHVAAHNGFAEGVSLLLAADESLAERKDKRGRTARDWAKLSGCSKTMEILGAEDGAPQRAKGKTLVLSHEVCSKHYTCPPRFTSRRGYAERVPPENVNRLKVLLDEDLGILRSARLGARLDWSKATRANIADILRVHDFQYVDKLQGFVRQLGENEIGELDSDTSISGLSLEAAFVAAGSVCDAVDRVCAGSHRNAFCAVRPPGHHAGPRGVVTCKNDPNGSYGFCLFSNAAIGAAYARHMYRHQGVKRVAIVDFDVHHGNGTEACVRNLKPSTHSVGFEGPFSDVKLSTRVYKPWLNEEDPDNVFFASIHGYGKRLPGLDPDPQAAPRIGMFYPSDGANFGFGEHGRAAAGEPRIVDVGQNSKSRMEWRASWRKHVLPELAAFKPDLIVISAGFDAHKQDDINMGYISALEHDYYWLTDQLVRIANSFSKGRIVSVLEGGYKIQGRVVSPFARSVCAHVAALAESSPTAQYDPADAAWEQAHEDQLLQLARLAQERRAKEAAAAAAEAGGEEGEMVLDDDDDGAPQRKRSRRSGAGQVDYKALNEKLNEELEEKKRKRASSAESGSGSGSGGGGERSGGAR